MDIFIRRVNKARTSLDEKKSNPKDPPSSRKKLLEMSITSGEVKEDNRQIKPAVVQVMDKRGNLQERKIVIGISNRVQVQVVEGLSVGEKIVSGVRPFEKTTSAAGGASGASGGANATRMMR